ncbi:MAG: NAD-dependent epimerase/dehydratase family protein [bacterium]
MRQLNDFYKDKKVLVTGGSGFIGSHLVEKLIEYGAKVTILDNFSNSTLNNLKKVITQINLIFGDIRSSYTCHKATKGKEIVFHTAAFVSVPKSIDNPKLCHEINFVGTKNLLNASIQNNVQTFILSSSAAVYGEKDDVCKEEDDPNPQSPYAQSKLNSENSCKEFFQKYNLNCASLRYFNVYGDRQNSNGDYAAVVAKFKQNLIDRKPIIIFGDGKQLRDFIHVSKIVEANLKMGMLQNLNGEIFNIASGQSINLLELINQLEKELKIEKTQILFKETRPGDIINSKASCSKYKNLEI